MLTAVSVLERKAPIRDPSIVWIPVVTLGSLAFLIALILPRICGPWCGHRAPTNDELAQRQVDTLTREIDPDTCRRSAEVDRFLLDPWRHPIHVFCAPGRYLWVVSDGADGQRWTRDELIGRR